MLFFDKFLVSGSGLQFEILQILLNHLALALDTVQVARFYLALLDHCASTVNILFLFVDEFIDLGTFTHQTDFLFFLKTLNFFHEVLDSLFFF